MKAATDEISDQIAKMSRKELEEKCKKYYSWAIHASFNDGDDNIGGPRIVKDILSVCCFRSSYYERSSVFYSCLYRIPIRDLQNYCLTRNRSITKTHTNDNDEEYSFALCKQLLIEAIDNDACNLILYVLGCVCSF